MFCSPGLAGKPRQTVEFNESNDYADSCFCSSELAGETPQTIRM